MREKNESYKDEKNLSYQHFHKMKMQFDLPKHFLRMLNHGALFDSYQI